jgi:hypothetical protein
MEKMELEYMDSAKEKKVYIVNCCGFDSVPADEGMAFTKEQFHYCAFAEARPTSCHCTSHVTLGLIAQPPFRQGRGIHFTASNTPKFSNSLLSLVSPPCSQSFLLINSDPTIGYAAHATTFECVVHGVGAAGELKEIRKKLADKRPIPVPFLGNKLKVIPP